MYKYNAVLIRVIDGDTLVVELDLGFSIKYKTTIRLFGVDTPEIRTRNLEEKAKGLEAKKFVENLLANQSLIVETIKDRRGSFGRYLADVIINEEVSLIEELRNSKMLKNNS